MEKAKIIEQWHHTTTNNYIRAHCEALLMIWNNEILFIHTPKTAGMSLTHYLANNLHGDVFMSLPEAAFEHARKVTLSTDAAKANVNLVRGLRHEDLIDAHELLSHYGRRLSDFETIISVARNPYDLEVSAFYHLQKSVVLKVRPHETIDITLAKAGDFTAFAKKAPFWGYNPSRIDRWFMIEGQIPSNMTIVRFENLEAEFLKATAPFTNNNVPIGARNVSKNDGDWYRHLTAESEAAIYRKHNFLFKFYPRAEINNPGGSLDV